MTIDPKPFEPTTFREVLELEAALPSKMVRTPFTPVVADAT